MELEPDQQAFVDAVMRPLGDDPTRRELLEEAIALASTLPTMAAGDDALTAAGRMQESAPGFLMRHRTVQASITAIGIVAAWFVVAGPPAWRSLRGIFEANWMYKYLGSMCCSYPGAPPLPGYDDALDESWQAAYVMKKLPPAEASLIIGEPGESDRVLKWQRVWENHPGDPAHFCAYALAYRQAHQKWPADLVTTGERLDPGNGWYRLMAATETLKESIGDEPPPPTRITRQQKLDARDKGQPLPQRPAPKKPVRIVIDPAGFDRGWRELDAALAMPRCDDHRRRLDAIRVGAWPTAIDYPEFCASQWLTYAQPEDVTSGWIELRALTEAVEKAAAQGDKEVLEALETRLKTAAQRLGSGSDVTLRSLVTRNVTRGGALALSKAWTRLEEADRSMTWKDFADATDPARKSSPPPVDALTENRGSNLTVRAAESFLERSPDSAPVTEADLRGGRLAEYAMYERLMLHATALLFVLALGFLMLAPLRDRRALGLLPARLAGLLDGRDRLRIFVVGVALPMAAYFLCTHPPGLVTRSTGISAHGFFLWLAQSVALVVAVILGTLQSARRQLDRRGKILALGWVGPDPGRLCFLAALLAMPLGAILPPWMARNSMIEMAGYATIGGLVGFPLLWLLWQACGSLAGSLARRLHRGVLMQAAAPFVAAALIITAIAIPWVYSQEKAWTKEIRYEALGPANTLFEPRLEREYAVWIARDLLDRLDEVK